MQPTNTTTVKCHVTNKELTGAYKIPAPMRIFPNHKDLDPSRQKRPFQDMGWGNGGGHQTIFAQIGSNNTGASGPATKERTIHENTRR